MLNAEPIERTKGTATYSPDDNKLRFYPRERLERVDYDRIKAAGFSWAPKQELFVAGRWTPSREDLLIEWCGEIEDEDKTLVDRAEERAERFEDYSEKRAGDADRAHATVAGICDGIPLGQPILIGHHSERRARKDAERIRAGMDKAVKMWETSKYWRSRAAGALQHAKYKELPAVRARRIKGIESDQRKMQAEKTEGEMWLRLWTECEAEQDAEKQKEAARRIASRCHLRMPRKEDDNPTLNQRPSAYDVLENTFPTLYAPRTVAEVIEHAKKVYPPFIAKCDRWLAHYTNRLEYERAMLQEAGGLITDRFAVSVGGQVLCGREWLTVIRVNRSGGRIVSVTTNGRYGRVRGIEEVTDYRAAVEGAVAAVKEATKLPPLCNYDGEGFRHMTKAEFDRSKRAGGARVAHIEGDETRGAHRIRRGWSEGWKQVQIFVTDMPVKGAPAPTAPKIRTSELPRETIEPAPRPERAPEDPRNDLFKDLKQAAKAGVAVVTAPQLFPTPAALAEKLVSYAGIEAGHSVLEPSAGTGALLQALPQGVDVIAIEINHGLADRLQGAAAKVACCDFLEWRDAVEFDRIIMNPPFANGADIKHIQHARRFLKPGGVLVAICANGPRQREALQPIAEHWEDLPAGTFAEQGTAVNTALLVIRA